MKQHIVLIGFMGSGKSTVARRLSKLQKAPLIDVDDYIEKTQGKSINEIFAQVGEAGFRKIETQSLESLGGLEPSVISCGGGIVCTPENIPVLRRLGTVVWLKVSLEEARRRISDPSTRPLLNGPTPVEELFVSRLPLYEQAAHVEIDTHGKNAYQVARAIEEACKERGLL